MGIKQTLNLIQKSNILLVFNDYYCLIDKQFAMLVKEIGEKGKNEFEREIEIYQHLGLVELGSGGEKLKNEESINDKELIISNNSNTQKTHSQFHDSELNTIIEVNPYQKY